MTLRIRMSQRFMRSYFKAIFSLQGLVDGTIHDFVNKHESDPKTILMHYDKLAHMKPRILEMDVSGSHRLLAKYTSGELLLLDFGGHEITGEYIQEKYELDLTQCMDGWPQFWPEKAVGFFARYPDPSLQIKYESEVSPEWLFFLEEQQEIAWGNILLSIINQEKKVHFILGGPGTGKTCILLNLLKFLAEVNINVGIMVSDEMQSYLLKATGLDISPYRVEYLGEQEFKVVLIDDPSSLGAALTYRSLFKCEAMVVGFDPLQTWDDLTDDDYNAAVTRSGAQVYLLDKCYRQKENVGRASKAVMDVVAQSTPFLKQEKIDTFREAHQQLTGWSNEITFTNPHGYVQYYPAATEADVGTEVSRIIKTESLIWRHWPGVLILLLDCQLPESMERKLRPLLNKKYSLRMNFSAINQIKGLEYQHVLIFMTRTMFAELQRGFTGSGRKAYHQRQLLRIPFSRAKDSLVTFAIEG